MIYYVLLFLICLFGFYLSHRVGPGKQRTGIELFTLLILIIFSGTRFGIGGSDYFVYQDVYNIVPTLDKFNFNSVPGTFGMETGYLLLNSVVKTLGFSFYGFTLIQSAIFYILFYLALKPYFKNFSFVIIVFLYKLFYFNTFISMRQPIAICLFIFSIQYILTKKPIRYFGTIIAASYFHSSALFLLPLYFLNHFKITKQRFVVVNLLLAVAFILNMTVPALINPIGILGNIFSSSPILLSKVNTYFTNSSGVNMLNVVEYFILALLVAINFDRLRFHSEQDKLILKLFLITGLVLALFCNFEIITRIKDFFIIFYAYIMWRIIVSRENDQKKLLYLVATILVCFMGYVRFPVTFDGGSLIPYKSTLTSHVRLRGQ